LQQLLLLLLVETMLQQHIQCTVEQCCTTHTRLHSNEPSLSLLLLLLLAGLIDILQGPHLCTSLQLNAVICLVKTLLL
jgi:hypothetical protein